MNEPTSVPETDLGRRDSRGRWDYWAWASLDFANSGYTTVVITAVFNAYFVSVILDGATFATLAWTLVLSVSYVLVLISAPFLGAYADAYAAKRRLLAWATALCVLGTLGLSLTGPGDWAWAAVLLVVSNLAYASHQNLSAGFLHEIADEESLGKWSGLGWAWGYLGGLLTLLLALGWVQLAPGLLGESEVSAQVKVGGALVLTALVFAAVGFVALAVLRERSIPTHLDWTGAWARLWGDFHRIQHQTGLVRFLLCVVVYQAGVAAVIGLAAVYAQAVMGFDLTQTILLVLVVNITASLGAAGFALFHDRLGHRNSLALSLLLWIAMVGVAAWGSSLESFWIAANLAGLAMGSSQSGARAAVASLAPLDAQSEAFGAWGVAVHLASICGPLVYGLVTWITNNDHRLAILSVGAFFVVGLVLLMRVPFQASNRNDLKAGQC
jgi:UMF1 family MFS transporter